jgi:hypothetical protein
LQYMWEVVRGSTGWLGHRVGSVEHAA